MKSFIIWILLILASVWIVLKESKRNTQLRKQLQEAHNSLRLYTPFYVGLLMLHLLVEKSILLPFIDDFSRYGYVYLLHEKSQSVDTLEVFVTEVERQLSRKVKIVKSDKGGEYYERYDESEQSLGPFAKFLQRHDICAQYTMRAVL